MYLQCSALEMSTVIDTKFPFVQEIMDSKWSKKGKRTERRRKISKTRTTENQTH